MEKDCYECMKKYGHYFICEKTRETCDEEFNNKHFLVNNDEGIYEPSEYDTRSKKWEVDRQYFADENL